MYRNMDMQTLADFENILFVSFDQAGGEDLPQVESDEDVIIDLLQERTHHSRSQVAGEMYDPSPDGPE